MGQRNDEGFSCNSCVRVWCREDDKDYYLIKNSWGPYWTENGYAKVMCHLLANLMHPIIDDDYVFKITTDTRKDFYYYLTLIQDMGNNLGRDIRRSFARTGKVGLSRQEDQRSR